MATRTLSMPAHPAPPGSLPPFAGFAWVEQSGVGRKVHVAGAEADWARALDGPAAARGYAVSVRLVGGVPTGAPTPKPSNPADPEDEQAVSEFVRRTRQLLDWFRGLRTNIVTSTGSGTASRDDVLRALLKLRPGQVMIGLGRSMDDPYGGTFVVVDRASLPAPAADAFDAARRLAGEIAEAPTTPTAPGPGAAVTPA